MQSVQPTDLAKKSFPPHTLRLPAVYNATGLGHSPTADGGVSTLGTDLLRPGVGEPLSVYLVQWLPDHRQARHHHAQHGYDDRL